MGNIRNHKDTKLVASQEKYGKYVMKPTSEDGYPFLKKLFVVEICKTNQDEQYTVPWTSNVTPKQVANI